MRRDRAVALFYAHCNCKEDKKKIKQKQCLYYIIYDNAIYNLLGKKKRRIKGLYEVTCIYEIRTKRVNT